jgi:hypothetical protein
MEHSLSSGLELMLTMLLRIFNLIRRISTCVHSELLKILTSKQRSVLTKLLQVIAQLIQNDVSSTKIRLFLRREMSVQYLIPAPVIEYINEHGLYEDDGASSVNEKGKAKAIEGSGQASPASKS